MGKIQGEAGDQRLLPASSRSRAWPLVTFGSGVQEAVLRGAHTAL